MYYHIKNTKFCLKPAVINGYSGEKTLGLSALYPWFVIKWHISGVTATILFGYSRSSSI